MNILKHITAAALVLACGFAYAQKKSESRPSGMSGFALKFSGIYFATPQQALEAYVGNWVGEQVLSVNGKEIATALVQQTYVPVQGNEPRIIGTGKISMGNLSEPTRCYMSVRGKGLLLEIVTASGAINRYVGVISGEVIEWVPEYFFMAYDYQSDIFYKNERGVGIYSSGRRYVEVPQDNFKGFLDMKSDLTKDDSSLPMEKIKGSNSTQFDIPSLNMQN